MFRYHLNLKFRSKKHMSIVVVFPSIYLDFNILQHPIGTFGKAVPYPAHGNQGLWKILRGRERKNRGFTKDKFCSIKLLSMITYLQGPGCGFHIASSSILVKLID